MKVFLIIIVAAVFLKSAAANSQIVDFELAKIDGSSFVKNSEFLGKKTILFFFSLNCPPCLEKLEKIKEKKRIFKQENLVIINLNDSFEDRNFLRNLKLESEIILLQAPANAKIFLRKFGNNLGVLPFVVLLNENGEICQKNTKLFDNAEIQNCN